jgi:hypothetical protein
MAARTVSACRSHHPRAEWPDGATAGKLPGIGLGSCKGSLAQGLNIFDPDPARFSNPERPQDPTAD